MPLSVAGVHRRAYCRAYRRAVYGGIAGYGLGSYYGMAIRPTATAAPAYGYGSYSYGYPACSYGTLGPESATLT